MMPTPDDPEQEAFRWHLRVALNHLYEPRILRASPLQSILGLEARPQGVNALQRLLTDAIEALRPGADTPPDSGGWRAYHILRRRYTEQVSQATAALDLGLSVRHMQREEKQARELLAEHLWVNYDLEAHRDRLAGVVPPPVARAPEEEAPISREQELTWLRDSDALQVADAHEIMRRSLETAAPLLRELGLAVEDSVADELPPAWVRPILLEQGVIGAVTAAAELLGGGGLTIAGFADGERLCFILEGLSAAEAGRAPDPEHLAALEMAGQLVSLAGGELSLAAQGEAGAGVQITLRLPQARQATVLVVDDNADALQLIQRHLNGTRYRVVGLRDAGQAIALAEEVRPQAILLDVMMPGRDGWTLLGQLREHPLLQGAPIVVCTVLLQEHLARTLGAAEFLRKPVSRALLVATLDRLLPLPQTPAS